MLRLLLVVLSATSLLLSTVWPAPSAHADDSVYWVDVRTPEEYQQGHLPGTLNIEYQNIDVGLQALGMEHDAVIYLHCRSGNKHDQGNLGGPDPPLAIQDSPIQRPVSVTVTTVVRTARLFSAGVRVI